MQHDSWKRWSITHMPIFCCSFFQCPNTAWTEILPNTWYITSQCHRNKRNKASILEQYNDVFTGLGKVEGVYHISVAETASPVIHAPRKVPPLSIMPKLKSTLKRLEDASVISKVSKPTSWVNSMVIVEKKDGSLQICIDPKELNESIQCQYKTVPTPEEISSKLCRNEVFTVIDMADCYWHIKLDQPSSELCTFNTPYSRYKFNRNAIWDILRIRCRTRNDWKKFLETFRVSLLYMTT